MKVKEVKVIQSYPTLCNLMDYTVHGILQARILDWVAFPFSRGSSQPRGQTQVSRIAGGWILYQLSHKGSPRILEWVAYTFSSGSSKPRNQTEVSCIAGGFFTNWATREAQFCQNLGLCWPHEWLVQCFSSVFWKSLHKFGINLFLDVWINTCVKLSGLEFLLMRSFW